MITTLPLRASLDQGRARVLLRSFWIVLALVCCGRGLVAFVLDRHLGVYPIYHAAGKHWLEGADLYDDHDSYTSFRYSPFVAALLAPCGALPIPVGNLLWRTVNVAVFLFGVRAWSRHVLPADLSSAQRIGVHLLTGVFAASGLLDGQANPLVIGLLLLAAAGVARDRFAVAAAAVTVACLLKLYPVAFGLLILAAWPRRFALYWLLCLAAGILLPFFLQNPGYVSRQYPAWLHLIGSDQGRQDWPLMLTYRDLRLLCRVAGFPMPADLYTSLQLGVAGLLALIAVVGRLRTWPRRLLVGNLLGLACCWMLVLGPATEGCTYIFLAPSLGWAIVEAHRQRAIVRAILSTLAGALLLVVFCAPWFPGGSQLQQFGLHPLAGLLLFVALLSGCFAQMLRPRHESLPEQGRSRQAA